MILEFEEIYSQKPRAVIVLYNFFQPCYTEIQDKYQDRCYFATDLTENVLSNEILGPPTDGPAILLIDDLAHRLCKSELLCRIFIGGNAVPTLV